MTQTQRTPLGVFQTQTACPNCRGTGKIIKKPCAKCGGAGRVRKTRKFKVNIPAGIDEGQSIQQRGQGNAGVNGGPAGDLFVTVSIRPHPIFTREGQDVYVEIPISFAQAALGDTLQVPTICLLYTSVLAGQAAVSLFQLVLTRAFLHAQYLVIISFVSHYAPSNNGK